MIPGKIPCLAVVVAAASALAAPSDSVERAETFLRQLEGGDFAAAVAGFDEVMAEAMPPEKLRDTWVSLLEKSGALQAIDERRSGIQEPHVIVDLLCRFDKGPLVVRVVFRPDGRISGLWYLPVEGALPGGAGGVPRPTYVDDTAFSEEAVEIGKAPWKLPGTLLVPKGKGPFPAVLLLAGSGPNDRDETIGPNKPLRNLAESLSSRGIVTLRYDKRTLTHGAAMAKDVASITLDHEVLDDAHHAITFLRARRDVVATQIFCLGHSLGGSMAPLVAKRDGKLAGLVLMAAAARPLDVLMKEQLDYLHGHAASAEEKSQYDKIRSDLAALVAGKLPKDATVLGATRQAFRDFATRDILKVARTLAIPMLVLQGGRDYQVTAADLSLWKDALADRANATFKTYPQLNHLFFEGKGASTPAEYAEPHAVAPEVVGDVAAFVLTVSSS